MRISFSAPAKVILSGEHAVVYGKPALVSAVNLRLKLSVWESKKNSNDKTILYISQKVKEYLKKQKINFENKQFDFNIDSQIPIRRGLGSSAALSIASVAALLKFYTGKEFEKEIINNVAYQIEKFFHKNASGVDVSAACFGGLIYYRKEFEFLKNISSLNFKIPKKFEDNLFLIDTGKPDESTGEMVISVGRLFNKKPRFVEEVLNDIEKTTKKMVISIIKEDENFYQKIIVDNQVLLEMLRVVSIKAKEILKQLEPFGVGKITGGGGKKEGSGYLLFYANRNKALEEYCRQRKISFFKFKQSHQGVKKEL